MRPTVDFGVFSCSHLLTTGGSDSRKVSRADYADWCSTAIHEKKTPTEPDIEHAGGGHRVVRVCSHTLEVAGVGGVQVADAEARAVGGGAVGDAAGLLHHGRVVLQPADGGRGIPRHAAVQLRHLPQGRRYVVHGGIQREEVLCGGGRLTLNGRPSGKEVEGRHFQAEELKFAECGGGFLESKISTREWHPC